MINPFYLSDDFVSSFSASFRSRQNSTFPPHSASVSSAVYPVAIWPDFLLPQTCDALRSELAEMSFVLRSSDLYEFHQTSDLKHVNPQINPLIAQLCSELYSKRFLEVMQTVTGRKLGNHVDISGQRYQQGDFLLCHDDRLEKRRIALILYLIDKEAAMQGGRLFALRSDEEGKPVMNDPQTITPQWNTLAFFEVTRASFHQVEQVFSEKIPRYSITCWFHDESDESEDKVVDDNSKTINSAINNAGNTTLNNSVFPMKFGCQFDFSDLLKDFPLLSRPVHRQYVHGHFLSSAQYSSSLEPRWIANLLTDSFHRTLERITGWYLDWPTKPVAWCLSASDHYYRCDGLVDRQQDVEYNYKERSVSVSPPGTKLNVSLIIRYPASNSRTALKPFFKLHLEPICIKKLSKKYSKIIIVSMKFNKAAQNQRNPQ